METTRHSMCGISLQSGFNRYIVPKKDEFAYILELFSDQSF